MPQVLRRRATVAYTSAVAVIVTAGCAVGTGEQAGAEATAAPTSVGIQTPATEPGFERTPPPEGGGGGGGSGGGSGGDRVIIVSGPTLENRYPAIWNVFFEKGESRCSVLLVAPVDGVSPDVPVRVANVGLTEESPNGRFEVFEPTADDCQNTVDLALADGERVDGPCAGALLPPSGSERIGCRLGVRFVGEDGTDSTARVQLTLEADCPTPTGTPCTQVPASEEPTAVAPVRVRWTVLVGRRLLACLDVGFTDSSEADGAQACPTSASADEEPDDPVTSAPAPEITDQAVTPSPSAMPEAQLNVPPVATQPP